MRIKRGISLLILSLSFLFAMQMISSAACNLDVVLINQDPYPAIPGDYVDVVFQINGVDNPDCGIVKFEVKEDFPFSLDPSSENPVTIRSGTYERKYSSFFIAPYKIRVNEDALDGDMPLEVSFSSSVGAKIEKLKSFNINVDDSRADFEIFVKNYDSTTNIMTLEVLNIGENDIEALTIEIPKQEHIEIKGPNRNIVGDLDSNEYTTADFEAISGGGNIGLNLFYTDIINVRRNVTEILVFDPEYFEGRTGSQKTSIWTYIIILLIVGGAGYWWYRRRKKNHAKKFHLLNHSI